MPFVSGIKLRDHLPLEQVVERSASTASQAGSSPCSWPSPKCPPHFRRVGFRPPAVQFREIDASIDEHFHAARAASLPGPARRVDPDVHSLHQALGQKHVVVAEEDHMGARLGPPDEMRSIPGSGLARLVLRMRLAGDDELHRALRIAQQTKQPLRVVQQQVRPLVGREAARKAQRQRVGIKQMLRPSTASGDAPEAASCRDNRSRAYSTRDLLAAVRNCQSLASETRRMSCSRFPSSPASGLCHRPFRPEIVGCRRVPGRHVDSVGHMSDRHFVLRPVREKRLKEVPADFPVQATHAIHRPAPADCQIGHVETLRRVVRVLAAQGQQIVERYAELSSPRTLRGIAR
jgi:hypothetical protein